MNKGKVKFFDETKGFGFIKDEKTEILYYKSHREKVRLIHLMV